MTHPEATELIGSAEACRLLGHISRSTLTRWVESGQIAAATKLPGKNGAFLFHRTDIEALAKQVAAWVERQPPSKAAS